MLCPYPVVQIRENSCNIYRFLISALIFIAVFLWMEYNTLAPSSPFFSQECLDDRAFERFDVKIRPSLTAGRTKITKTCPNSQGKCRFFCGIDCFNFLSIICQQYLKPHEYLDA